MRGLSAGKGGAGFGAAPPGFGAAASGTGLRVVDASGSGSTGMVGCSSR
jgi:hypothetical protein